jgi:AcrR family transcriptional regulator
LRLPKNENRTRKQRDKISVRDKILHTAHDLFYSTGLATGVDTLIKEAKVTKVTFIATFRVRVY